MPQLLPFYFVNQISFLFLGLATLTYFFSKYYLPAQLQVSLSRAYLTSL